VAGVALSSKSSPGLSVSGFVQTIYLEGRGFRVGLFSIKLDPSLTESTKRLERCSVFYRFLVSQRLVSWVIGFIEQGLRFIGIQKKIDK